MAWVGIGCGAGGEPQGDGTATGETKKAGEGAHGKKNAGKAGGRRGGKQWGGGPGADDKEEAVVAVVMESPQAATISRYYEMSGTLQALRSAQLRPVQSGILTKLFAEEGDQVKDGQLLARLDGRERAMVAARDELTRRNAARELDRLEAIASSHALSREELDKQRFALEAALADTKLSSYQAKLNLIRAPFSGVITVRNLDVGNLATSGDILFEIADVSALELELHVPEREASKVAVGAKGRIELLDSSQFEAKVLRRAPVVDPLTGTVKLTLSASEFPPAAVPGAFARAKILLESRENVTSLPKTAVFELEGRPHVYAVVDGKAQRMPVELGLEGDDRIELKGGLDASQLVVVDGAMDITDGMSLKRAGESHGDRSAPGQGLAAEGQTETASAETTTKTKSSSASSGS